MISELLAIKLAALAIVFAMGLLGLLIFPLQRRLPRGRLDVYIGYLNAMGSGVMVNVALVHMLHHSEEDLSQYLPGHFPWAMAMAGVGYGLVYLCEDVLLATLTARFAKEIQHSGLVVHTHVAGVHTHIPGVGCAEEHEPRDSIVAKHDHDHDHHHHAHEPASEHSPLLAPVPSDIGDMRTAFMALSLQLVISVHSVFEGLGLGAERRVSEVVSIFIAILVHKGVESFLIASAYLRSTMRRRLTVGLMVLFAFMSPLGIGVGILISTKNESVAVLRGLLVSMAAGTFLYVGTLILKDQDHVGDCLPIAKANNFLRFLLWCTGFLLMSLVALWEH